MNNIIKRTWRQGSMVIIEDLQGMAFQAESGGHTFQISGIDGEGNTVALSGTPAGVMLRADGQDVALTCSVSGGVVSATLPANAYVVPGRFGLTIFLTSDGQKTAIYAAVGTVGKTSSGTVAPPAGSDVVDLVNQINTAIAAIPASYNSCFAPAYSTSGLYSVGQYVTYNGNLYRCNTAITTAETWTSAHWTQTNLGADVYDLKSAISDSQGNIIPSEELKSAVNKLSGIEVICFEEGYITTNGTTVNINSVTKPSSYKYAVVECSEGDVFTINGTGGNAPRLYCFINDNETDNVVDGGVSDASFTLYYGHITAPMGATKLVINSNLNGTFACKGKFVPNIINAVIGIGEKQNYGYLAHNNCYKVLSNNTVSRETLQSYTDYIRIPENAESVTVRGITKNLAGTNTYTINPDVLVYDENYTLLQSYGNNNLNNEKTRSLQITGAKYIRVNQPADVAPIDKYIRFNYAVISQESINILTVAHMGLIKSYALTATCKAYLFKDGLFAVYGSGIAPAYSYDNVAPWITDGYLSLIKKIYVDDRVTIANMVAWFTVRTATTPQTLIRYGMNRIEKRIDIPKNTTELTAGTLAEFDVRHINLCTMDSLTSYSAFPPKAWNRHMIISIPSRLCTESIIEQIVDTLKASVLLYTDQEHPNRKKWLYSNVVMYITDSQDLNDALTDYIYNSTDSHLTVQRNVTCIYCDNLGIDGFPSFWNERMKACITEIIPYMGRQTAPYKVIKSNYEGYPVEGLTSLSTYGGVGWLTPQSTAIDWQTTIDEKGKALQARLYAVVENDVSTEPGVMGVHTRAQKLIPAGKFTEYLGQPVSTDLGNLAMGLVCTGFVNFIFWRYFNENFGMANSGEMYNKQGKLGNPLPLEEIEITDLKPFDILCWRDPDQDDPDPEKQSPPGAGHVAIFLGSYTDENGLHIKVMQSTAGMGITFGRWAFIYTDSTHSTFDSNSKYFRLKTNVNGFRYNVIAFRNPEDEEDPDTPDVDPDQDDPITPD